MKDKKVTGSRHGFTKGEVMPDHMIAFYEEITDSEDEGRTKDGVRTTLVSLCTLSVIYQVIKYILDASSVRQTENLSTSELKEL